MAAIFYTARYICAAITVAGTLCDYATFHTALKSTGAFLPSLAVICLVGGVLFLMADCVAAWRKKK